MEAFDVGVEILVHLHPVGVELQLRGVKQRLRGGEAGNHLVHGLDEVDDVGHGPVGHGGSDVAGHRVGQGGAHVGEVQLLGPRPLAVQDVAEALDHDVARPQHVGQLPHPLGVGDGLVEGEGEVVGTENGQVGVVAFELLVAVAVDHRQVVVVVLLADEAAGVLTEGADLVLKRLGVPHQLGLIEHPVDGLHHLAAHLHPHADVHGAGLVGDVVLGAQALQPIRPPAAGGDDGALRQNLLLLPPPADPDPQAGLPVQNQVRALIAEQHLHPVLQQVLLDGVVEVLGLLGAQVADGAVHQLQPRLNGPLADGLDLLGVAQALNAAVRAELQVNPVGIADGVLSPLRPDEGGQVAPHLAAEAQLAVGEGAGPGEAGGDVAVGLAADALAGLALGAAAVLHRLALLHEHDALAAAALAHLQGGKDPGGTCADNNHVFFHRGPPSALTAEALITNHGICTRKKIAQRAIFIAFPPGNRIGISKQHTPCTIPEPAALVKIFCQISTAVSPFTPRLFVIFAGSGPRTRRIRGRPASAPLPLSAQGQAGQDQIFHRQPGGDHHRGGQDDHGDNPRFFQHNRAPPSRMRNPRWVHYRTSPCRKQQERGLLL